MFAKFDNLKVTTVSRAALGLCTALLLSHANAEFADPETVAAYGPATLGGDKLLKLEACSSAEGSPNMSMGGHFKCGSVQIEAGVLEKNGRLGQYQVNLKIDTKRRFRIAGKGLDFGFLDTVHSVDLNNDGQPDYVLEFSFHGVGLAATNRTMVFLLSGSEYSWQAIAPIRSPAARHFYTTPEGNTVYLTSRLDADSVVSMPRSADNKRHRFWVFEPLIFSKANGLWAHIPSANYPLWVQYQSKPSNRPTDLISAATQKRVTVSPLKGSRGGKMQPLG